MPVKLNKLLIAARGEIALRIIRTARTMGLATVGIFSDDDINAPWIRHCDESWSLGNGPLNDTYLNIDKITAIAINAGADCLHPGYGFLSENHFFAQKCEENNIRFIGPSAKVLRLMGNKPEAHDHVKKLGYPVPERYAGSPGELRKLRADLQYPVMVKAASGGGGKGMRMVTTSSGLDEALRIASLEAAQFFGNPDIYIESYLPGVRHVEIQILGDSHGNLVHLFERECSVQRRHQKLIEESPAGIGTGLRDQLISCALGIARSVHYCGAGTVEFLTSNDRFWFLEVNPRIQVEHGVTEMVTGIDIVREQILVAEGRALSFTQEEIPHIGHSIEARIYAEDPENNLLPSPGIIKIFRKPDIKSIRIETAVEDNLVVSADFDPLIAKVIVHEPDRLQAMAKITEVLESFVITGIKHNLPLLAAVIRDKTYKLNQLSTTWLETNFERLAGDISIKRKALHNSALAAAAIYLLKSGHAVNPDTPWQYGFWRNVKKIRFRMGKEIIESEYSFTGNDIEFQIEDSILNITHISIDEQQLQFKLDHDSRAFFVNDDGENIEVSDGLTAYYFARLSDHASAVYESEDDLFSLTADTITAPQPGTIMDIKVSEGQLVKRGDYLLTIESMKLENTIMAVKHGYIKKIAIKAGDKVRKNEPLIYLQDTINN